MVFYVNDGGQLEVHVNGTLIKVNAKYVSTSLGGSGYSNTWRVKITCHNKGESFLIKVCHTRRALLYLSDITQAIENGPSLALPAEIPNRFRGSAFSRLMNLMPFQYTNFIWRIFDENQA